VKTLVLPLIFGLAACGNGLDASWLSETAPAGSTSFTEYKQTLTIKADGSFRREVRVVFAAGSLTPGCTSTVTYDGTWTEPKGGQLRFVALNQKDAVAFGCDDAANNYTQADGPVEGSASTPLVVDYKLSGASLEFSLAGAPFQSFKRL
jgi:hypothetical protein